VVKSTSSEELSNFSDFVWSEELETQFMFARNTYNHLQTSYALDIIYTAIDFLIGMNVTQKDKDHAANADAITAQLESKGANMTVRSLLERNKDYDFGYFLHHYAHYYYQVFRLH
jgi:hypothetical protein